MKFTTNEMKFYADAIENVEKLQTKEMRDKFADMVRWIKYEKAMPQSRIAEWLGCEPSYLTEMMRGGKKINPVMFKKLVRRFLN